MTPSPGCDRRTCYGVSECENKLACEALAGSRVARSCARSQGELLQGAFTAFVGARPRSSLGQALRAKLYRQFVRRQAGSHRSTGSQRRATQLLNSPIATGWAPTTALSPQAGLPQQPCRHRVLSSGHAGLQEPTLWATARGGFASRRHHSSRAIARQPMS
jgi:hypothetical protein